MCKRNKMKHLQALCLPLPHYCRNYFKIVHLNKKRNYCYLLTKLHKAFSQSLQKEKKYLPFTPTAGIISTFNIFKKREISVIYLQSCNKAFSQSLQKKKKKKTDIFSPSCGTVALMVLGQFSDICGQ